jgi:hypothetical protein
LDGVVMELIIEKFSISKRVMKMKITTIRLGFNRRGKNKIKGFSLNYFLYLMAIILFFMPLDLKVKGYNEIDRRIARSGRRRDWFNIKRPLLIIIEVDETINRSIYIYSRACALFNIKNSGVLK